MILAVGLASLLCALLSLQLAARAWIAFRVPRLAEARLQEPERRPTLSVVIAACNEAIRAWR